MSPEEFERIKAEEKAHLRKLRELKQTHRDVQRKASIVNAVRGMRNPELEAETDALTDSFYRDAAHQEARLDLALDSQALDKAAAEEADKAALAKEEAAALIRQMKAEMGERPGSPEARPSASPPGTKSIGRTPPPDEEEPPAPSPRDAKSIGRPRGQ
jgi:hypothetical protein